MPRYRVTNQVTKETQEVEALYAQVACERFGWMIGNCHIKRLRERGQERIAKKEDKNKKKGLPTAQARKAPLKEQRNAQYSFHGEE